MGPGFGATGDPGGSSAGGRILGILAVVDLYGGDMASTGLW
jgi:hypothetical protein